MEMDQNSGEKRSQVYYKTFKKGEKIENEKLV